MTDLLHRMEELRLERIDKLAALNRNTIAMRLAADEAHRGGLTAYRIAILMGLTNRTVYLWLKK